VEENIKVAVRMRPLNEREANFSRAWRNLKSYNSVIQTTSSGQSMDRLPGRTFFTFDKTFEEDSTTTEVYEWAVKNLVESVVKGRNGSLFTYGQTSSGKTYTMQGAGAINSGVTSDCGLIHLASEDIFLEIAKNTDRDYVSRVSVIEIYNEEVRDLLSKSNRSGSVLVVRENLRRGIFVNAIKHEVKNAKKLLNTLSIGEKNRSVGSTTLNQRSSRSHLIFSIYIESSSKMKAKKRKPGTDIRSATLNFVDLAGSEGVRHRGNSSRETKQEGGSINKSLLTLSRVISAIGSSRQPHISFRDSKLTRVLQPALSGNARLFFICCATCSDMFLEETRATLQFASRLKRITTKTQVNFLDDNTAIERMEEEFLKTKEALAVCETKLREVKKENKELKALVKVLEGDKSLALKRLSLSEGRKSFASKSEGLISSGGRENSRRAARMTEVMDQDLKVQVDFLESIVSKLRLRQFTDRDIPAGQEKRLEQPKEGNSSSRKLKLNGLPMEISVDNLSVFVSEATEASLYGSHKDID